MTTTTAHSASEGRGRVAQLFTSALDDDEHALRELQLLALELTPGNTTEVLEADEALRAIDGPRPDGSCPPSLENQEPAPGLLAYVDQLEARYRNQVAHTCRGSRPVARMGSQAADSG